MNNAGRGSEGHVPVGSNHKGADNREIYWFVRRITRPAMLFVQTAPLMKIGIFRLHRMHFDVFFFPLNFPLLLSAGSPRQLLWMEADGSTFANPPWKMNLCLVVFIPAHRPTYWWSDIKISPPDIMNGPYFLLSHTFNPSVFKDLSAVAPPLTLLLFRIFYFILVVWIPL